MPNSNYQLPNHEGTKRSKFTKTALLRVLRPASCPSCTSEKLLEDPAQPSGHAAECSGAGARCLRYTVMVRIQHDANRRGEHRAVDVIGQSAHTDRTAPPD